MSPQIVTGAILLFFTTCTACFSQSIKEVTADLLTYIAWVQQQMPGAGSNRFVAPSDQEIAAWRPIVRNMMAGKFGTSAESLAVHFPFYSVVKFTDSGYAERIYYLLLEDVPIARGWGTYVFHPQYARELSIQSPHSIYDADTHTEGADIFRETGARTFLLAGTHRCASDQITPCDGTSNACGDGKYHISDVAHYARSIFQVTHEEIVRVTPQIYAISVHGHSSTSCPDIFLSNGPQPSHRLLFDIKSGILALGDLTVAVNGDGSSSCVLVGSTNVQGRFTNGSQDPCTVAADSSSGYFIHIEQSRRVRRQKTEYEKLILALNNCIPERTTSVKDTSKNGALLLPKSFSLFQSHPNPFHSSTAVQYALSEPTVVTLDVFNLEGHLIKVLHEKAERLPDLYTLHWNGEDEKGRSVASGLYFFRLHARGGMEMKKVLLLR